jgi:hypothetical protein
MNGGSIEVPAMASSVACSRTTSVELAAGDPLIMSMLTSA